MKELSVFFGWAVGTLFWLRAVGALQSDSAATMLSGVFYIGIGVLLVPPSRELIERWRGQPLTTFRLVGAVVVMFVLSGQIAQSGSPKSDAAKAGFKSQEVKAASALELERRSVEATSSHPDRVTNMSKLKEIEAASAKRIALIMQQKREYFNANRQDIVASATTLLEAKQYSKALRVAQKYVALKDPEIDRLYHDAMVGDLLVRLKGIPVSKAEKNLALYKQLVTLEPSVKTYRAKVAYYSKAIASAKLLAEENANMKNWVQSYCFSKVIEDFGPGVDGNVTGWQNLVYAEYTGAKAWNSRLVVEGLNGWKTRWYYLCEYSAATKRYSVERNRL